MRKSINGLSVIVSEEIKLGHYLYLPINNSYENTIFS